MNYHNFANHKVPQLVSMDMVNVVVVDDKRA